MKHFPYLPQIAGSRRPLFLWKSLWGSLVPVLEFMLQVQHNFISVVEVSQNKSQVRV